MRTAGSPEISCIHTGHTGDNGEVLLPLAVVAGLHSVMYLPQ